jgi:hypothetical protein
VNTWSLVGGVVGLNACLLVVGYAVSAPFLRGLDLRALASYAGVCLLLGTGLAVLTLSMLSYTHVRIGLTAFAAVSGALVAAGLAARLAFRLRPVERPPARPDRAFLPALVTTVAGYCVLAICAFALVGGFRSSPWLDDSWFFWLPKGLELDRLGLRDVLFRDNGLYVPYTNPDYPFWWSILMNLDTKFVGGIDMRAIDAQLTFMELAFVGSVARLLWGRVRQWALALGLLALVVSPELLREAQGGSADLPLALFLGLLALGAALWLARGEGYALLLAFVAAAAALEIKLEGWALVLIVAAVALAFGLRSGRRRVLAFAGATVVAFVTAYPWWHWKSHVAATVGSSQVGSWSYLDARLSRIWRATRIMAEHAFDPREWAILVPLVFVLAFVGWRRSRGRVWLAPVAVFVLVYAFWVVAFWTAPEDRITGSVYRIVMTAILPAAVFLPVLIDRLPAARRALVGAADEGERRPGEDAEVEPG